MESVQCSTVERTVQFSTVTVQFSIVGAVCLAWREGVFSGRLAKLRHAVRVPAGNDWTGSQTGGVTGDMSTDCTEYTGG